MVLGEELESRFFKILSIVSSRTLSIFTHLTLLLTEVLTVSSLGLHNYLHHRLALYRSPNDTTINHRQDVLCAVSRNGSVPKEVEGR